MRSAPPKPVLDRHTPDEGDGIRSDPQLAWSGRAAYSTPEETESRTVPSKHGLRLYQEQGLSPLGNEPREQDEQAALVAAKARAFDGP
jgi:hypothetical protein